MIFWGRFVGVPKNRHPAPRLILSKRRSVEQLLSEPRRGGRVATGLGIRRGPQCVRLTGEGLHELAMLAPSSHVARLRVPLFTSLVFMGSASFRPTDDCSGGLGACGRWTNH